MTFETQDDDREPKGTEAEGYGRSSVGESHVPVGSAGTSDAIPGTGDAGGIGRKAETDVASATPGGTVGEEGGGQGGPTAGRRIGEPQHAESSDAGDAVE